MPRWPPAERPPRVTVVWPPQEAPELGPTLVLQEAPELQEASGLHENDLQGAHLEEAELDEAELPEAELQEAFARRVVPKQQPRRREQQRAPAVPQASRGGPGRTQVALPCPRSWAPQPWRGKLRPPPLPSLGRGSPS